MIKENRALLFLVVFLATFQLPAFCLDADRLVPQDIRLAKSALKTLKLYIGPKKSTGAMNLLTFQELYDSPLTADEKNFLLEEIRFLDPKILGATAHTFENPDGATLFMRVPDQTIQKNGIPITLPRHYLPREVHDAYQAMMTAMKGDLGKILYVDSGYRSPAYQLYLFLYYLPKHGYSLRETNRFVALPGHSEHGAPERQAIDFINAEGINGEDNPEAFEALPEYAWLTRHARDFGFVLSYPRDNAWGTSFEPWHWHYEGK